MWSFADVFGLSGSTGKPRWRCRLPRRHRGDYAAPILLAPEGEGGLPRLLADPGVGDTLCLRASPTTPEGHFQMPRMDPIEAMASEPRPLPWTGNWVPYPVEPFNPGARATGWMLLGTGLPALLCVVIP